MKAPWETPQTKREMNEGILVWLPLHGFSQRWIHFYYLQERKTRDGFYFIKKMCTFGFCRWKELVSLSGYMTGQKLGSQPYTFTMNSGSEYQWGCKKHVLGEMSLLLKSWESHALAKLCLRAVMESVGHWPLHKDVTLTSSMDGEAMGCRHTARAILQRFLCSSFSSLMSGDLSCCGVRRRRVMQAASSWRHLTEDPVLWETDTPGGFQSVLEWR